MTAKIKLNAASGGGSISLKAPSSTTGNAAIDLQLPVADGSADTFLKTDGSGILSFAAAGGGKILQVLHTTDNTAYSQSSDTYTDMGLSATITPQTNSKVLILIRIHTLMAGSDNEGYGIKILRDSTDIYTSPMKYELYQFSADTSEQRFRSGWNYLDSSVGGNGSNAITYKVQVATLGSRSVTFTEQSSISSITLLEIGA